MMRAGITLLTLASAVLFPWQATALCALGASFVEPLVPFATGLLLDALYYLPQTGLWPRFTLWGALISFIATFVQSRLRTRSM